MATSILMPGRGASASPMSDGAVPDLTVASQPFDWNGIRPVYRAMHAEFWQLTKPFSLAIPDAVRHDLAVLITAMDAADRELDRLPDPAGRERFGAQVTHFLSGIRPLPDQAGFAPDLFRRLGDLREVLRRRKIRHSFVSTARKVLELSERKRTADSGSRYLTLAEREWRMAGRLPLLILGTSSTPRFESFFLRVCQTMHMIDTALDARKDFRSGLMAFRPGLRFHAGLLFRLFSSLPSLMLSHPGPLVLIRYACRLLQAAVRPEQPVTVEANPFSLPASR
jgi:hypothetical protein